jgi:hypothetical protein
MHTVGPSLNSLDGAPLSIVGAGTWFGVAWAALDARYSTNRG